MPSSACISKERVSRDGPRPGVRNHRSYHPRESLGAIERARADLDESLLDEVVDQVSGFQDGCAVQIGPVRRGDRSENLLAVRGEGLVRVNDEAEDPEAQ